MQFEIIYQGLELLVYGMGTVVLFLALLILTTMLMSRVIQRYFPEPQVEIVAAPAAPAQAPSAAVIDDEQLVAVITAAIHQHRKGQ
ncbi:OadG family protein [Parahaliea sp. F7430]|uniref:Probable oxaloacetate decarboxylase gamma chain n=1 Tax=Sediminihaliea albiluteola TaxID=2758564 RepID=A0A7W2YIB9_9GAMM|nr:OadG family protein [Sediminihaliea albiluteola]MBA6411877.1 OadG family protein [Sediminihaliea albiluteola]